MAAGAWTFYNSFKEFMGDGTVDLDTDTFRITLHTSASNAATATLTAYSELTNEVTEANGYSSSGQNLASVTWAAGASASEMRWDAADVVWSASGGTVPNVRYAVISDVSGGAAGKVVAYSALSTAQFTVGDGDTLTVSFSANGIFELN